MNEKGYICATNVAKIRIAMDIVRDIFGGDDHGVPLDQQMRVIRLLLGWHEKAGALVNAEMEKLRGGEG